MAIVKSQKIAFIATVYRHIEAFHLPFISELQLEGYEVHVFANKDHGRQGVLSCNVICHDIPFQRNPFHPRNILASLQLIQELKKYNFKLVHVNTPVGSIVGRLAARITMVHNVIYTAHGFHFFKGGPLINWLIYYSIERLMSRWTDCLLTINNEDYTMAQRFPVRGKTFYVPGVGVEIYQRSIQETQSLRLQMRGQLGLHSEDFVIICIAELINRKNHNQLIEAMRELKRRKLPIKCLIVGDGIKEDALRKKVSYLKLEEHILFLGFRRDIRELIIASDVVTLLSHHEGLPKSLLEALAEKKAIVATNVRGNRDLVEHGENGFIVDIGNAQATANAFETIFLDPVLQFNMGMKSGEKSKSYTTDIIIKQMNDIYRSILG